MISGRGSDTPILELGKTKFKDHQHHNLLAMWVSQHINLYGLYWQNGYVNVLFVIVKYDK